MNTHRLLGLFVIANLVLFGGLSIYYDAIEMPNRIGYVGLFFSIVASLLHYLLNNHKSESAIRFGFVFFLSLMAIFHNLNFLISSDDRGQYVIEDRRPIKGFRESWNIRLANQKIISMKVSEPPSTGSFELQLRKGLFQVYFGSWKKGD